MYYLTKSNGIISDKQIKESKNIFKCGSSICYYVNIDDDEFETLDHIIKESDNVFDLIEVGDLVEESDFNEIYKVKIFDNGKDKFRDRLFDQYNGDLYVKYEGCDDSYYSYIETLGTINIVKIFKPNTNGDYIKVWEKESE